MRSLIAIMAVLTVGCADFKLEKTDEGFVVKDTKTYYKGKIIWGDTYTDHNASSPLFHTEVVAYAIGWHYTTTTDDDGSFKVEVKPNTKFKIKASDGNRWATSPDLVGIADGTVGE